MSAKWPWSALGIESSDDAKAVKRAYSQRLKSINRDDPEEFHELRSAYEEALSYTTPSSHRRKSMREIGSGVLDQGAGHEDVFAEKGEANSLDSYEQLEVEGEVEPKTSRLRHEVDLSHDPSVLIEALERGAGETDPDVVERAFWVVFDDLCQWPLPTEELGELLGSTIAQDISVRQRAESDIYQVLEDRLEETDKLPLDGREALLIEDNFGWLSDGVGFNNRLGWHFRSDEVLHALNRAHQYAQGRDPDEFDDPEYSGVGYYRIFYFVIWAQIALFIAERLTSDESMSTFQAIILTFGYMLIIGILTRLVRVTGSVAKGVLMGAEMMPQINKALRKPILRPLRRLRENRAIRPVIQLVAGALLFLGLYFVFG